LKFGTGLWDDHVSCSKGEKMPEIKLPDISLQDIQHSGYVSELRKVLFQKIGVQNGYFD
jgi:hypothetical protein